jgi:hypothetical protein
MAQEYTAFHHQGHLAKILMKRLIGGWLLDRYIDD